MNRTTAKVTRFSTEIMKPLSVWLLVAGCIAGVSLLYSQAARQNTDWSVYNGSPGNSHYSALKQINQSNVSRLQVAWTYDTSDAPGTLETNPIVVNGILYGYTPGQKVFAINAATGKEIWKFDSGEPGRGNNRGLSYWRSGPDQRIFAGIREYVYSLDAKTGKPDPGFGDNGRIDFRADLRGGVEGSSGALGHPPVIYKDLVIFAGHTSQVLPAAPAPVRAYDARTGKLRWKFNTIPQPGEFGYETWPKDAWKYQAGAASWPGMSLDEKRGIVYVPTSNLININNGRDRPGDNLFGNTLLALDAETGKRIWHFQTVKHDVWDRDITSPPSLITVKRGGRDVDAVEVATKSGFVWLFDRANGTPLFPIEYKKYPASSIPGEQLSETQPLPTRPAPFARQLLKEDMLTLRTPEAHAEVLARFKKMVSAGQFVPPSVGVDTVMFPGMDGGGEWGGAAFDPDSGLLYINSNEMAWLYSLAENPKPGATISGKDLYRTQCAVCHGENRTGAPPAIPSLVEIGQRLSATEMRTTIFYGQGRMTGFPTLPAEYIAAIISYVRDGIEATVPVPLSAKPVPWDTQYRFTGQHKFLDMDGYPAVAPPWGTLNAINMNTGEYAWKIPLGEYPELAEKGMKNTGSENYGGPVVTAGGLVFIAATNFDRKFRAFDKQTGRLLWETTLPFPGNATPATYEIDGRQFIVIAASGSGVLHNQRNTRVPQTGASYIAFALPAGTVAKN
jgi:quinoprotein glucose dehydrogenase